MNTINLMPVRRRQAKATHRHLMNWAGGLAIYCLALLLGCIICNRYIPSNNQELDANVTKADTQLKSAKTKTAALNEDLAKARQRLQTVLAIQQQPDWGKMLDMVARNLDNQVVLDSCRLQTLGLADKENKSQPAPDASKQTDGVRKPIVLELTGLAKNQSDVSDYMLRLEKMGLFSKIRLIKTSNQAFLDHNATMFHLECLVSGDEGNVQ